MRKVRLGKAVYRRSIFVKYTTKRQHVRFIASERYKTRTGRGRNNNYYDDITILSNNNKNIYTEVLKDSAFVQQRSHPYSASKESTKYIHFFIYLVRALLSGFYFILRNHQLARVYYAHAPVDKRV